MAVEEGVAIGVFALGQPLVGGGLEPFQRFGAVAGDVFAIFVGQAEEDLGGGVAGFGGGAHVRHGGGGVVVARQAEHPKAVIGARVGFGRVRGVGEQGAHMALAVLRRLGAGVWRGNCGEGGPGSGESGEQSDGRGDAGDHGGPIRPG